MFTKISKIIIKTVCILLLFILLSSFFGINKTFADTLTSITDPIAIEANNNKLLDSINQRKIHIQQTNTQVTDMLVSKKTTSAELNSKVVETKQFTDAINQDLISLAKNGYSVDNINKQWQSVKSEIDNMNNKITTTLPEGMVKPQVVDLKPDFTVISTGNSLTATADQIAAAAAEEARIQAKAQTTTNQANQSVNNQAATSVTTPATTKPYVAFFCPGNEKNLSACIGDIYKWAVSIGGALAILMIIVAGYSYATSAGDVEKTNKAKEIIVGAITGIILLLAVVIILNTLKTRVNINGDKYQFDATKVDPKSGAATNSSSVSSGSTPNTNNAATTAPVQSTTDSSVPNMSATSDVIGKDPSLLNNNNVINDNYQSDALNSISTGKIDYNNLNLDIFKP